MERSWMIDELAHAGAEHLDPDFVAEYDQKQGHPDAADDIQELLRHGVDSSSTVIDLGAGTGQFTFPASQAFGQIVAVDISSVMIDTLRQRATDEPIGNVTCVRAGMLTYDPPAGRIDAIFSRNALHQLPDFWKGLALHRMSSMLRPGGVLRLRDLVYDCTLDEVPGILEAWLDGAATDPRFGYTREDFIEHVQTEHSTFRWLLEPMLLAAGFHIETVDYRKHVYAAYTCIKT